MSSGHRSKSRSSDKPSSEGKDSFWAFWEENEKSVLKICLYQLRGDRERAREVVSETMIKALDAWDGQKNPLREPERWLLRIATNLCRDLYRKEKRHPQEGINDRHSFSGRQDGPGFSESPEDSMLRREMYQQVRGAINLLPESIRKPSVLRWYQDMPYQDIAKQLNLSPPNVRKRVQKGRGMVQAYLQPYLDKGKAGESSGPEDLQEIQAVKEILENLPGELSFAQGWLQTILARMPDGSQKPCLVSLDKNPTRLKQKHKSLTAYVKNYPTGWKKRFELAMVLYLKGDWDLSLSHLKKVLEKQAQSFKARMLANHILDRWGYRDEALQLCREALPFVRSDAARLYFHAWTEFHKENYPAAAQLFAKAGSHDTGITEYHRQQIRCLLLGKEWQRLDRFCIGSKEAGLQDPLIDLSLFASKLRSGQREDASWFALHFLEKYPKQLPGLWMHLLSLDPNTPDFSKAQRQGLRRIRKEDPTGIFYRDVLHRFSEEKGPTTDPLSFLSGLLAPWRSG